MLFNSFAFVFGFLPLALLLFYGAGRLFGQTAASIVLSLSSLAFYAWWRPQDLWILLFAIGFNYVLGAVIQRAHVQKRLLAQRLWLGFGLVVDIGLLGYYKYANFIVDNVAAATGANFTLERIILPLAISFFTFQKIAYLIDSSRGEVSGTGIIEFSLFASFFPQLLAGPIVHYKEIIPQLREPRFATLLPRNLVIGLVIFAIGLFKKTVIADTLGGYANPLFADPAGQGYDLALGWTAAITYTFQLYFDFSGYSDMAIGLGRMFGVKLPLNFHSPLRAGSVIDYWRRWHMTLQRFILSYIYQPLALPLNRLAAERGLSGWNSFAVGVGVPTFFTFLIIGIWHGAGWTFVVFGLMHAFYVLTNEFWRERRKLAARARRKAKLPAREIGLGERIGYHVLTLVCVALANVMFRATSIGDALVISKAMFGLSGGIDSLLAGTAVTAELALTLVASVVLVAFFPNVQQIMARYRPAVNWADWQGSHLPVALWQWRPDARGVVLVGVMLFIGVMFIQRGQAVFLYFNF